jgi:hypothetical protein
MGQELPRRPDDDGQPGRSHPRAPNVIRSNVSGVFSGLQQKSTDQSCPSAVLVAKSSFFFVCDRRCTVLARDCCISWIVSFKSATSLWWSFGFWKTWVLVHSGKTFYYSQRLALRRSAFQEQSKAHHCAKCRFYSNFKLLLIEARSPIINAKGCFFEKWRSLSNND